VTRIVDAGGAVSFAGVNYRCGVRWARQTVEVSIVGVSDLLCKGVGLIVEPGASRKGRRDDDQRH